MYLFDYRFEPTRLDLSKYKIPNKPRDQWTEEEIESYDQWCRLVAYNEWNNRMKGIVPISVYGYHTVPECDRYTFRAGFIL